MKISVIIPAYNEEEYIAGALESITRYAPDNLLEIIVVDNASTDKTAEIAKNFKLVRIAKEVNKGLTKARQKGLTEAKGDLLAYIDADTQISSKWFHTVISEFKKNNGLVCLSGPYIYYDLPRWQRGLIKLYNKYFMYSMSLVSGNIINGGNFIAKKDALLKIGGFDTSIAFYGEDINIATRLKEVGKVKFLRNLYVYTSGRRLKSEGVSATGFRYFANFLSETLFRKPVTNKYKDIR